MTRALTFALALASGGLVLADASPPSRLPACRAAEWTRLVSALGACRARHDRACPADYRGEIDELLVALKAQTPTGELIERGGSFYCASSPDLSFQPDSSRGFWLTLRREHEFVSARFKRIAGGYRVLAIETRDRLQAPKLKLPDLTPADGGAPLRDAAR